MSFKVYFFTVIAAYSIFSCPPAEAQVNPDSSHVLRNTIRVNITNPMIFGKKFNVLGYERVLNPKQSFSVGFGRFALPKFIDTENDTINLSPSYKDKGLNFSVDYRFYLAHENKYPAPRGIYVGPYYAFNFLERENSWTMNTSDFTGNVSSTTRLNANLIGAQMGYQFIIRNRLSIDIILMGPGVWFYSVRTKLGSNLDQETAEELYSKINELLAQKFPGHEITLPDPENYRQGSVATSSIGFRYIVNIGFRF